MTRALNSGLGLGEMPTIELPNGMRLHGTYPLEIRIPQPDGTEQIGVTTVAQFVQSGLPITALVAEPPPQQAVQRAAIACLDVWAEEQRKAARRAAEEGAREFAARQALQAKKIAADEKNHETFAEVYNAKLPPKPEDCGWFGQYYDHDITVRRP